MKARKEDIAFVINPSLWYQNMYPSGILCLSGYLESKGVSNIILDSKISSIKIDGQKREGMILNQIKEARPRIVCFSASHREFDEVVRMNNEIKKLDNSVVTIVGGSQPTYRGADFLDNGFSFVCIGEGEATLCEFVKEVLSKSYRWTRIDGLGWRNGKDNIFNQPRKLIDETTINSVSMPPYDKIDKRYFDINVGTIRGLPLKGALLLTTRGCPFSCSYCGCNLIFGKKLRFKSLENIEREIKYLRDNYDIEGIWIVDDTFTIKENHAISVSKILKRHDIIWGCQSRVDTINEKLMKIMKESGCVQIDFGVESGSQRILNDIIGKGTNVEQIIHAFNLAKKYKIRTLANFMIGLPTETYSDLKETEKIAALIDADIYLFAIATPLPGTRLYNMINEKISPYEYSLLNWNGSILTERFNKSKIKDLIIEKDKLHKKYFFRTMRKSVLSMDNYLFFLKKKYKYQRLKFVFNYFVKYIRKLLNEKCFSK
ncbi:MAG: radical SAM protein [bacterium]|nr:radical SAM protein [bacterium]